MPMKIGKNANNSQKSKAIYSGFLGGLNTFQDETLIKDSELTEAKNILLSVDGVQPRPGTTSYGTGSGANPVDGMKGYYKSTGVRELLTMSGGSLRKYNSSDEIVNISSTFTTDKKTSFIQALDKMFIINDTDGLSYYDGSSVTTFTAISTPTGLSVTPQGTTGSTTYSYKVNAFNDAGETLATSAVTTSTGNATLSSTNFNRLDWNDTTGATGYNVYGRTADGLGETFLDTVYESTYDDKGQRSPSATTFPPENNNTGGINATKLTFAISRIFAAGDPDQPSRLYWSDTGTRIGNFNIGLDSNAGFVDVFKNDGYTITGILAFQGGVIVWKENAIYKFDFVQASGDFDGDGVAESVSLPQLSEITRSFGGASDRGIQYVENDVIFPAKKDGRLAFYSLGNQENYAGTVLRTNELSIKIQERLKDVNVDYLNNAASFYYNNVYGCAIATDGSSVNNRIWCLDTRFGAWVYWDGLSPSTFEVFNGSSGTQKLYYGSETDGQLYEMFKNERNDNGSAISVLFSTKSWNDKRFDIYKRFQDPVLQFKDVTQSGALTGEIYADGNILQGGFTVNQQIGGGAGPGFSLFGKVLFGEADGGSNTSANLSSDVIVEVKLNVRSRALKFSFASNKINLDYKFLSLAFYQRKLDTKRLPQSSRFYAR